MQSHDPSSPVTAPPAAGARSPATVTPERYRELARRVKLLSWLSLGAMSVEGVVAIFAGVLAGSTALVGFGLDSAIEGLASVIVIWRFTGARVLRQPASIAPRSSSRSSIRPRPLRRRRIRARAGRRGAPRSQSSRDGAGGVELRQDAAARVAKQRIADPIGSAATKGEGRQNLLGAYLAGALRIGLLGNAVAGAWWLDPVVGLLIAGVAVKEGLEAWRGDGCCVGSPLDGFAVEGDGCQEDCCG